MIALLFALAGSAHSCNLIREIRPHPCHPCLQELTDGTYSKWRDFIQPKPDELEWMKAGWRPSFWEAVLEAQEKEKPVLLWAMNGHPLACT